MDAKIGGRGVTPRAGKAVEINALWYNALRTLAAFLAARHDPAAQRYGAVADRVRVAFRARFVRRDRRSLLDVVDGPEGDDAGPIAPDEAQEVQAAHDGDPVLLVELLDIPEHGVRGRRIEARHGLVREDQLGVLHQRPRNRHPLLLPARERVGARIRLLRDPDPFQVGGRLPPHLPREIVDDGPRRGQVPETA